MLPFDVARLFVKVVISEALAAILVLAVVIAEAFTASPAAIAASVVCVHTLVFLLLKHKVYFRR